METLNRVIALQVEYEGTAYAGWQRQDKLRSVQGEIETALEALLGSATPVVAAGRTDAGVHALAQVCSFQTASSIPVYKFPPGLGHYLPKDIRVVNAAERPAGFSARHDSAGKHYRYTIYNTPQPRALGRRYGWWVHRPLLLEAMEAAARHFVGELNFESFRSVHCGAEHAHRSITRVEVSAVPEATGGQQVWVDIEGNAFCRHMCRIIAGTLVLVGKDMLSVEEIPDVFEAQSRAAAGPTAPAQGLCLMRVHYPAALDSWPVRG